MGCKVEKIILPNGESSDLFRSLAHSMSPARALETYLDVTANKQEFINLYGENSQGEVNYDVMMGTPKFRLSEFRLKEFKTYRDQADTMDFLAKNLIDTLKEMASTKSNSTISGIDLNKIAMDPSIMPIAIRKTIQSMDAALTDNFKELKATDAYALRTQAIINMSSYLSTESGLGPLGYKLKDYGVHLNVRTSYVDIEMAENTALDQDPDADILTKEIQTQRIYDMDILETSPSNTVTGNVKVYLKNLPKVAKDYSSSEAALRFQPSRLGVARSMDYAKVYGKMQAIMKGINSPTDMINRLERAAKESTELLPILNDLKQEQNEPATVMLDGNKTKYKPIATALYTTFAKADYNMFTVAEDNGKVVFYQSNSVTKSRVIQNQWAEDITAVQKQDKKALKDQVIDTQKYMKKKGLEKSLNRKSGPNLIELNDAAELFRAAGFYNVTGHDLKNLIQYVADNKVKLSSKVADTPFRTIKFFTKTMVEKVLQGKDIYAKDVGDFDHSTSNEARNLKILSGVVAARSTDTSLGAFYSGRGTMVYPINQGSEAQDVWGRLKDPEVRTTFSNDPIYQNTSIMNALDNKNHMAMFDVGTMDVLNDNAKPASGVTWGNLSSFDAAATKLNAYFAIGNDNYQLALSPTQGDRGKVSGLTLPKLGINEGGEAKPLFIKGMMEDGEIQDWIYNQIQAELKRIAKVKASPSKYKNYGTNAIKFNLFTDLNSMNLDGLVNSDSSIRSHAKLAMTKMITEEASIFKAIIDEDIRFLESINLLVKEGNHYKPANKDARRVLSQKIGKNKTISAENLQNVLANNLISTYDQSLFYVGDLAFFNSKSDSLQKVDINKRFALVFTPGSKLATGPATGIGKKAKIKILQEPKWSSSWADVYQNVTDSTKYKDIEIADGMGFVSLQRYRSIMMSQGMHNDGMLAFIDAHLAWKPGKAIPKLKSDLEVLKTFFYRIQPSGDGTMAPFNLKYSIMPVIPAYFEAKDGKDYKYGDMAAISKELRTGEADEVVMSSAVKVGESNAITSASELTDGMYTEIYNDSVRIPQVSPVKNDIEVMFGTQMRKIIVGNYSTNKPLRINSQNVDPGVALQNYDDAIKMITKKNGDEVYNTFLKGGEVNEAELVRKLLSDLDNNPHNNVDYYKEALTVVNAKERLLPLNYPTIKYKIDSLINAAFRNKVNRLKMPGHTAVQVTSFGTNQIGVGSDLKFLRVKPVGDVGLLSPRDTMNLVDRYKSGDLDAFDGYEITPGEIRVTPKYFTNTIRKIALKAIDKKEINKAVAEYEKNLPEKLAQHVRGRMISNYKKGRTSLLHNKEIRRITDLISTGGQYDIVKVRDFGLDTIVLYRIPTGGKNLMMPGVIKDFLPEGMGSTIQVPAEIVDQAGSDFDIDKVTIEMTDFKEDGHGGLEGISYTDEYGDIDIKSEAQAKSYIKDFHAAILSSPQHFADVLRPDGVEMIKNLADNVFNQTDDMFTGNWASLTLQETFRNNNKAGKDLISISSVSSVAHAIAPHIGSAKIKYKNIAGKPITILGEEFNRDLNTPAKISTEIAEIQTASLDNTKEPLLGKLNINKFTASTVLMLVSHGFGLEYATTIVNAPIVKDLANIYPMFDRSSVPTEAIKSAAMFVQKKYKIDGKTAAGQYNSATYTLERAKANLDGTSKVKQAIALEAFLDMQEVGDGLGTFQGTMNFDSKGTPSTVPGLLSKYIKIAGVPGTDAYARERNQETLHRTGKDATKSVEYKNKTAMLKSIVTESKKVNLRPDKKMYEVNVKGTVVSMDRLSTKLGNVIDNPGPAVTRANNAGTIIDDKVREFFEKGSIVNTGNMSQQAEKGLNKVLGRLKDHFETTGEKVVTNKDYLKVYDTKLKVAGEMDLITIDNNMRFRIYDMKSEKDSTIAELMQARGGRAHGYSRKGAENFLEDRYNKRGKQLNGYRGLMRNMTGILADELNIIPIPLSYNEDGTYIEEIRQSPELFESHEIAEGVIVDTRVFEDIRNERILAKLSLDPVQSMYSVDPVDYNESYMGEVERQTIHAPLTVNRKASPSASVQLQLVLREATKAIGYMNEKQEQNLFIAYDTYLALNSKGSKALKSSLAKRLMTKSQLAMTNQISGTASKLQAYRDYVKNLGIDENAFTENLTIVTLDGRKYVAFNNMVARGLSADSKKEMMYYFEDLMNAGENTIEQKLAKELADYAMIHYGFSRQFNSFLEFIPPSAHQAYMNTTKGDGKVTLPNFFRQIQLDFDNTDKFHPPEDFVEMYVQNNADKLPLRRIPKTIGGDLNLNWRTDLMEEAMRNKRDMPSYILRTGKGETTLWALDDANNYAPIQKRGVQGFVTEYYNGDSLYNDNIGEGTAEKGKVSVENQAVIDNIERASSVRPYFDKVSDLSRENFTSKAQAMEWVGKIKDMLEANPQFTKEEIDFMIGELDLEVNAAVANFKRIKKVDSEATFNDVMVEYFEGVIDEAFDQNYEILKKIINCK